MKSSYTYILYEFFETLFDKLLRLSYIIYYDIIYYDIIYYDIIYYMSSF
jgi:hypothetical protein